MDQGYDIEDYYKIDEQFGDEETLLKLVKKAHDKAIAFIDKVLG